MEVSTGVGAGALVVLAALWAAPAAGETAEGPGWLRWTRGAGAESCIDAAAFASRVEAELGPVARGPADHPRVAVSIGRVQAGARAPRWSADLRLLAADAQATGSRQLAHAGNSCDPLTDGLALMVALLLAGEGAPTPAAARAPASAVVAATVVPPPALGTSRPAPASPLGFEAARGPGAPAARWTLALEGGPAVALGALPGLAAGVEARFWVVPGRGPALFARGDLWRTQRAAVDGNSSNGAELDLWTAGLGVCPLAPRPDAPRTFAACLVGDLGRLDAAGFGFTPTLSAGRFTTWRKCEAS